MSFSRKIVSEGVGSRRAKRRRCTVGGSRGCITTVPMAYPVAPPRRIGHFGSALRSHPCPGDGKTTFPAPPISHAPIDIR